MAGLLWERQLEKVLLEHGWEKVPNWECLFVNLEQELLLSMYVDDIKLAGRKQNIDPTWKVLDKEVDLGEPTSFLDHTRPSGKLDANISSLSYDMEGQAKKCVERFCELANKATQQFYKVATPCIDDHQFKEEEMGSVGDCQKFAHRLFQNACIWPALADLIFSGPRTNLLVQLQFGSKLATNVQRV